MIWADLSTQRICSRDKSLVMDNLVWQRVTGTAIKYILDRAHVVRWEGLVWESLSTEDERDWT